MKIVCLDLEGVLVPEIWIAFAKASGIPELTRTTREEPDYDKLMRWRLGILKEHNLGLKEIQAIIETIEPLEGAKEFLDKLRALTQVVIISDTFTQFGMPEDFRELVINGGCHAGFGLYGPQDGDGLPAITARKQIEITADAITEMVGA